MHKHTPGPWRYDGDYIYAKSIEGYVANPNTEDIQSGRCVSSKDAQAVIDANARLIAAAPDLLEALQEIADSDRYEITCLKDDKPKYTYGKFAEIALQAIAKVTS